MQTDPKLPEAFRWDELRSMCDDYLTAEKGCPNSVDSRDRSAFSRLRVDQRGCPVYDSAPDFPIIRPCDSGNFASTGPSHLKAIDAEGAVHSEAGSSFPSADLAIHDAISDSNRSVASTVRSDAASDPPCEHSADGAPCYKQFVPLQMHVSHRASALEMLEAELKRLHEAAQEAVQKGDAKAAATIHALMKTEYDTFHRKHGHGAETSCSASTAASAAPEAPQHSAAGAQHNGDLCLDLHLNSSACQGPSRVFGLILGSSSSAPSTPSRQHHHHGRMLEWHEYNKVPASAPVTPLEWHEYNMVPASAPVTPMRALAPLAAAAALPPHSAAAPSPAARRALLPFTQPSTPGLPVPFPQAAGPGPAQPVGGDAAVAALDLRGPHSGEPAAAGGGCGMMPPPAPVLRRAQPVAVAAAVVPSQPQGLSTAALHAETCSRHIKLWAGFHVV